MNLRHLDFEIDKLTNSIENRITKESIQTRIEKVTISDIKSNNPNDWQFHWVNEYQSTEYEIYKLIIADNPTIIQGLISLEVKVDHVFVHLIENAPFNKGSNKKYLGVAGNLFAFACKLAFDKGFDGYVSFLAKTRLIDYYIKEIGATVYKNNLLYLESNASNKLVQRYFKGEINGKE